MQQSTPTWVVEDKDLSILLNALKVCCRTRDLKIGKRIHADATRSGDDSNVFVANSLINLYAKCGRMVDAYVIFEKMANRVVVSWNCMIMGYVENGDAELALQLYGRMQDEGFVPNHVTFLAALKACASLATKGDRMLECFRTGKAIHSQASKDGDVSNIRVASALIDMYAKCGRMVDARAVFDRMARQDGISWYCIIMGYAKNGEDNELVLELYARMHAGGCEPNCLVFVAALKACSNLAVMEMNKKVLKATVLRKGKIIHSHAIQSGYDTNNYVENSLVNMYAKFGSMNEAVQLFNRMSKRDVMAWTALIQGYADAGDGKLGLQLFARMQTDGYSPDGIAFLSALKCCTDLTANEEPVRVDGKLVKRMSLVASLDIHSQAAHRGFDSEFMVANTLVDLYAKCGCIADAQRIFDRMPCWDAASWNALIMGYAQNGDGRTAMEQFQRMRNEGHIPNFVNLLTALKACVVLLGGDDTDERIANFEKVKALHSLAVENGYESHIYMANTLVDVYSKFGIMTDSRKIFDKMPVHSVVSWTALMVGYVENGEAEIALDLYASMRRQGCEPDTLTFVTAIKACSSIPDFDKGKTVHAEIFKLELENRQSICNSLIGFYGKCGKVDVAQELFNSYANKRDTVAWNALIAGYSHQGNINVVFSLLERMRKEGVQANGITFLSILTACSHGGLIEEGKEYFEAMGCVYGIIPCIGHYHCMVDMFGRANQMNEALAMVKIMPMKPNVDTWMTILGACWKWTNVTVGRIAFESVVSLDKKQAAAYVLMAAIYSSLGMPKEKQQIEKMRRDAFDTG